LPRLPLDRQSLAACRRQAGGGRKKISIKQYFMNNPLVGTAFA
jgi:hypothetical protein